MTVLGAARGRSRGINVCIRGMVTVKDVATLLYAETAVQWLWWPLVQFVSPSTP